MFVDDQDLAKFILEFLV